jgi:hypothetical protein
MVLFLDFIAYFIILFAFYSTIKRILRLFVSDKKISSYSGGCASCSTKCELKDSLQRKMQSNYLI